MWPPWVGYATFAIGALSIPLMAYQPILAILMAVLALRIGILGSRAHSGSARQLYRLATGLSGLTLIVIAVALIGLFMMWLSP